MLVSSRIRAVNTLRKKGWLNLAETSTLFGDKTSKKLHGDSELKNVLPSIRVGNERRVMKEDIVSLLTKVSQEKMEVKSLAFRRANASYNREMHPSEANALLTLINRRENEND